MKVSQVFVSAAVMLLSSAIPSAIAQDSQFSDTPIAATIEDQSGGPTDTVPFPGSKQPAPQASAKGLRGGWNDYYKKPYWNDYNWNKPYWKPYWGKPYWKPSSWGYRGRRGANRGGNNKNKSFWGSSSTSDRWESSNQGWGSSNQNYWGPSTSNQSWGSPSNSNQNYWGASTTSNQNYWGSPSSSTSSDSVPETEDQDFGSASFIVEDPEENEEEEGADFDNRPPESFESPPVEGVGPKEEEVGFDNGPPEGFGQPPPGVNANGPEEEEEVGQPPEGFGAPLPNEDSGPEAEAEAEEEGADFGNGPPVGSEFGARPPPSPSGPESEFGVGPPLNEEQQAALRILPLKTSNSADTYSSRCITCAVVAALYISLS